MSNECLYPAGVGLVLLLDLVFDVLVCALDVVQANLRHPDVQPLRYHYGHVPKDCKPLHRRRRESASPESYALLMHTAIELSQAYLDSSRCSRVCLQQCA